MALDFTNFDIVIFFAFVAKNLKKFSIHQNIDILGISKYINNIL